MVLTPEEEWRLEQLARVFLDEYLRYTRQGFHFNETTLTWEKPHDKNEAEKSDD